MTQQLRGDPPNRITAREAQILDEVAKGGGNKRVAAALGLAVKTIESNLQNIKGKVGIRDRVLLALWWDKERSKEIAGMGSAPAAAAESISTGTKKKPAGSPEAQT